MKGEVADAVSWLKVDVRLSRIAKLFICIILKSQLSKQKFFGKDGEAKRQKSQSAKHAAKF